MAEKNIELRSEKVRSIIGQIPPMILRIGTAIIAGVILIALALMYYIPYPQTQCFDVQIEHIADNDTYIARGEIKTSESKDIVVGQVADVLIIGHEEDYVVIGAIDSVSESYGYLIVDITISPSANNLTHISSLPMGEATIHISYIPILKRIGLGR